MCETHVPNREFEKILRPEKGYALSTVGTIGAEVASYNAGPATCLASRIGPSRCGGLAHCQASYSSRRENTGSRGRGGDSA